MIGPVVDIILPTNRAGEFLPATLESVTRQSWPHWRVTVIDDGSPNPAAVARLVDQSPGAQLLRQSARGVSAARNLGVRETSGPLVVFLDDDDLWLPNRLEKQVTAWLQAQYHVGVYCAGEYIDGRGLVFGRHWPAEQATARSFLAGEVPLPRIVTMMVTREVVRAAGGFDERLWNGEDLDFTLKVLQHGEMLAVPERLVQYRRHGANVSQTGAVSGRRAVEDSITRQMREATARKDYETASLLKVHRRRRRAISADEAVSGLATRLRRREFRAVLDEVRWVARTPVASLQAGWAKAVQSRRRGSRG